MRARYRDAEAVLRGGPDCRPPPVLLTGGSGRRPGGPSLCVSPADPNEWRWVRDSRRFVARRDQGLDDPLAA